MSYRVAPIFLIRMAGVPFERLECLETPKASSVARRLISENLIPSETEGIATIPEHELENARRCLLDSARTVLRHYLIFGGEGMRERIASLVDAASTREVGPRNSRARDRERHLLLYLQRVVAKNDTFSEFGPSGWGTTSGNVSSVTFNPSVGIAKREAFMERWTAHAVADVINADPENLNPKLTVPALEPYAMRILRDDVEKWPTGSSRDKWLAILRCLVDLPLKFAATASISDRQSIVDEARSLIQSTGIKLKPSNRTLYAAANPIAEACFRECHFEINESMINEVATQAEPWIDLWRDNYAFVASRVAATLRVVMEKAGAKSGVMPMTAFLHACEQAKLSLMGPGLIAPAVVAFQEVKATFRRQLQPHADLDEYELTAKDCHIIRDNFEYPKFDEYTYPSADLQLASNSTQAVLRGDYEWILAELHPPVALLHHGLYWSCPEKEALAKVLRIAACARPNFYFGIPATDFTAHTTVCFFEAIPDLTNFVAPLRANPKWKKIPPAEAEVFIDPTTRDVCLRKSDNHEYLGSFARAWVIPLGFHPFQFSLGPHTPRLRCGKIIVQRRSWTVTAEDLIPGDYTGVSSHLVVAVEKLRAEKNLPRYVYIRPTEQALRRSGAEGRDKDTKPVFIDLESYLFLEIFHRWIVKAGEIEVTEMLPRPDQLFWKEPDGRRTFELRTLIIPRS